MKVPDSPITSSVTAKYDIPPTKSESGGIRKIDTNKVPRIPVEYATQRTQNGDRVTVTAKYGRPEPKINERSQEISINERPKELEFKEGSLRFDKIDKVAQKLKEHCDLLDRRDWEIQRKEPKRKGEVNFIKGQLTSKPLLEWVQNEKFPFEFGNADFSRNPKVLISNFLSTFIKEGDETIGKGPVETRKFVTEVLVALSGGIKAADLRCFDKAMMLDLVKQFREEGRSLKADILEGFLIGFEKTNSKASVIERHAKDMVNELTKEIEAVLLPSGDPTTFMRSSDTNEIANILLVKGGADVCRQMQDCVKYVGKDKTLDGVHPKNTLKSEYFTAKDMKETMNAASRLLVDFSRLLPPPEVKEQLAVYANLIQQRVGVDGLSQTSANTMIQRLYNNCVILRLLCPTITSAYPEASQTTRSQLIAVSILVQNVSSNAGSGSMKSEEAITAYRNTCPEVWTLVNDILIQYGMPKECAKIPFKG